VFLGTSTSPDGVSIPKFLSLKSRKLLLQSHVHDAATSILYATTKIGAPANQFKSYSLHQNVTLLFNQMKNDLDSAVSRGNFTVALHVNSQKFNATTTAKAIITSTEVAPFVNYIPTLQPTTLAPVQRSYTTESSNGGGSNGGASGLTDSAKYGIIGGLVGGFALLMMIAFGVIFYRKKLRANGVELKDMTDINSANTMPVKSVSSESQVVYVA